MRRIGGDGGRGAFRLRDTLVFVNGLAAYPGLGRSVFP